MFFLNVYCICCFVETMYLFTVNVLELHAFQATECHLSSQEARASYKCMSDSNYNRNACIEFFKVYKDCKSKQVHNTLISVVIN